MVVLRGHSHYHTMIRLRVSEPSISRHGALKVSMFWHSHFKPLNTGMFVHVDHAMVEMGDVAAG